MDRWISQVHNLIDLHNIKNKKKNFNSKYIKSLIEAKK